MNRSRLRSDNQALPAEAADSGPVVFVLNHNGCEILRQSLPPLVTECDQVGARLIVVDNASSDGSREFVAGEIPTAQFFDVGCNMVLGAINLAVEHFRPSRFVFLVNDLIAQPGLLPQLLEPLDDERVFAVSCYMQHPSNPGLSSMGTAFGSSCGFRMIRGRLHRDWRPRIEELKHQGPIRTLMAGGHTAYNGETFRLLGGFDPIYQPFYWEDADLSMRAWRAGYEILYAPNAVVLHDQLAGTISKSRRLADVFFECNRIVYVWINVHDRQIYSHVASLAVQLLRGLARRDTVPFEALARALAKLPRALIRRRRARVAALLSDEEVAVKVNDLDGYVRASAGGRTDSKSRDAVA